MQTTWVVVADSSRARIFEMSSADRELHEIEDMANPQGRAMNRELQTEGYGRYYGKGEREQAHTAPPSVQPVEHAVEVFSKELGEYLDKARTQHRYDRLRLVAPPKVLGLLRKNLSGEAQDMVDEEIAKDIAMLDARDIKQHLSGTRH
jgi:protein required for attachment to host cells